jgi:hypothetical protein
MIVECKKLACYSSCPASEVVMAEPDMACLCDHPAIGFDAHIVAGELVYVEVEVRVGHYVRKMDEYLAVRLQLFLHQRLLEAQVVVWTLLPLVQLVALADVEIVATLQVREVEEAEVPAVQVVVALVVWISLEALSQRRLEERPGSRIWRIYPSTWPIAPNMDDISVRHC